MLRRLIAAVLLMLASPLAAQFSTPGVPSIGGVGAFNYPAVLGPVASSSLALGTGSSGVFDSGNGEGWVVTCPTCTAGQTFSVTRQGFTTTGTATTYTQTFTILKQLRQAYGASGTNNTTSQAVYPLAPNLWALSDYILSTDAPAGFANNSTLTAPAPIANWDEPSRQIVANSIHVGVVAFSRDAGAGGQGQVAAVCFTATDGTNTTTPNCVSTMQVSTYGGDVNAVVDYEATLNIAALNDNSLITVNAKVYPWIGDSRSVLDSSTDAVAREFSPRYYLKNTTRFATPYVAYVNSSAGAQGSCSAAGSDTVGTGGVWTTTKASTASPTGHCFASIGGAENAAVNATYGVLAQTGCSVGTCLPLGAVDGAIIYLTGPVAINSASQGVKQTVAALTITRDSAGGVSRATANLSTASAAQNLDLGYTGVSTPVITLDSHLPLNPTNSVAESAVDFKDLTITRTSTNPLIGALTAAPQIGIIFDNITLANASMNAKFLSNSHLYAYGVTVSGNSSSTFAASGAANVTENRILRGLSTGAGTIEDWVTLGGSFTGASGFSPGSRCNDKGMFAFNNASGLTGQFLNVGAVCAASTGYAIVQNTFETVSTAVGTGVGQFGADSVAYNINNFILSYNTFLGAYNVGRIFIEFDELCATSCANDVTARNYRFASETDNIIVQVASKADVFAGSTQTPAPSAGTGVNAAANRTGSWAWRNGAGQNANMTQFNNYSQSPNFSAAFNQEGFGLNAKILTLPPSDCTWYNPLFYNYKATTVAVAGCSASGSTFTAGAGGGDYHLVAPATFTASISGTAMTVTAISAGQLTVGSVIAGTGVTAGTAITGPAAQNGIGSYTVSPSQTVASETMTAAGSPCLGAVPVSGIPFALDGAARPATNDRCGAE